MDLKELTVFGERYPYSKGNEIRNKSQLHIKGMGRQDGKNNLLFSKQTEMSLLSFAIHV